MSGDYCDLLVKKAKKLGFRKNRAAEAGYKPAFDTPGPLVSRAAQRRSASSSPDSGHSSGDEWCPGHGSFSERRLKSDCVICRGEYMPEQTVSSGAGQRCELEMREHKFYDAVLRDGRKTRRCSECPYWELAGAGQVPADTIEKAAEDIYQAAIALRLRLRFEGDGLYDPAARLASVAYELKKAALAAVDAGAVRTPEEQT